MILSARDRLRTPTVLVAERGRRRCLALCVIAPNALGNPPVLPGSAVRLEPLTQTVLEDYLRGLQDPEVQRLTGTHAAFDPTTTTAQTGPSCALTTEASSARRFLMRSVYSGPRAASSSTH